MTDSTTEFSKLFKGTRAQGSTSTGQEELVEALEALTNQTGQLSKEAQTRPAKYNIQIRDLGDPGYKLTEPLFVTVEEYNSDEVVIVNYPELEVFGEGYTEAEALSNLKLAILDLYDELMQTPQEELGDLPRTWLAVLKSVIKAS